MGWLLDMDLVFNVNDESRVVVLFEDLERLVKVGLGVNMVKLKWEKELRNGWIDVGKVEGLDYEGWFDEGKLMRFNIFVY